MLTVENLESVFANVCEATEGKISQSQYLSRFGSLTDMLQEFEMSVDEVQKESNITFDVAGIKGPFIVADYAKESFIFLISDDAESIENFISDVTAV